MKARMAMDQLRERARAELQRYDECRVALHERRARSSPSVPPPSRDSEPDELAGVTLDRPSMNPG
jgi:hypothetical protein